MEFKIRYAFPYDGEMGVWVDEREMEIFLVPCGNPGNPDEKFRLILSKNILALMGIDWRKLSQKDKDLENRLRVAIDHHGLRIYLQGDTV